MSEFLKLGEEEVWRGEVVSVGRARFRGPDGREFERDVVRHPGAVSVVPITDGGSSVVLVRQYRTAVERVLLEVPAGKRDVEGEDPEVTAARELAEEVGMRAGRLVKLAEFFNTPGFCDEYAYLYLGLDLESCDVDAQGIEEQHMSTATVPLADVPGLISSGEIVDAKTIIGLCLAREWLAGPG